MGTNVPRILGAAGRGSGDEEVLSFARLSIGAPTRPARKGWRGPDSFARMWNDAFGERPTRTGW